MSSPRPLPALRLAQPNGRPPRREGAYVLYWMIAARRPHWNFALEHAAAMAKALGKPLLVFEPLRAGSRWASDRMHRFVIDGMRDHREHFAGSGIGYYPYVEPAHGEGSGLLEALAAEAALVVTDDFPSHFLPRMVAATAEKLDVRLDVVDGNGLLPMRAADRAFTRAFDFRRHLQRSFRDHVDDRPQEDPLAGTALPAFDHWPAGVRERWAPAADALLDGDRGLAGLAIDHAVPPTSLPGGFVAGEARARRFVAERLAMYGEQRNEDGATSGLSPYLHFGHVSAHQVFALVEDAESWRPGLLSESTGGGRSGWWGMSEAAESFLDELVTWRELGFGFGHHRPGQDCFDSLPDWAQTTLKEHAADPRPHLYTLAEFEQARTHDELWNAAQNQLRHQGIIHNYLRMLWGKKILHWSSGPEVALDIMLELNNRYALDGRDPNSSSGIFWVLGRYDRAWGPEREVFGKIRYMSSANTRRKMKVRDYVARWASPEPSLFEG